MEDIETKRYEDAVNRIFPGLQMFVRDTFLDEKIENKYEIGKILREQHFVMFLVGSVV